MKKFSFLSTAVLLFSVVIVLLISCQKEQNVASNEAETSATEENVNIVALSGSGPYSGSIKQTYASSLATNYTKKYGNDDNQTQYVAFSAKDLVAFINGLQTKYKSDIIYVNFGVYGRGALPLNSKDYGRLTVFFTGNKITESNTRRSNGIDETSTDQFLNHGSMEPH